MRNRSFRYALDPACLCGIGAYLIHKLWIKPTGWGSHGLLHDYLNDFLLIPVFLPPTLFLDRVLRIRCHDRPPSALEVAAHVVVWSIMFLVVFPKSEWLYRHSTADPYNAVAYSAGGLVAWLFWNRRSISVGRALRPAAYAARL